MNFQSWNHSAPLQGLDLIVRSMSSERPINNTYVKLDERPCLICADTSSYLPSGFTLFSDLAWNLFQTSLALALSVPFLKCRLLRTKHSFSVVWLEQGSRGIIASFKMVLEWLFWLVCVDIIIITVTIRQACHIVVSCCTSSTAGKPGAQPIITSQFLLSLIEGLHSSLLNLICKGPYELWFFLSACVSSSCDEVRLWYSGALSRLLVSTAQKRVKCRPSAECHSRLPSRWLWSISQSFGCSCRSTYQSLQCLCFSMFPKRTPSEILSCLANEQIALWK